MAVSVASTYIFFIRYGVQVMNQSKEKPSTVLTSVKELGMKMNEKTVTIRGRLHTSRAKGDTLVCGF